MLKEREETVFALVESVMGGRLHLSALEEKLGGRFFSLLVSIVLFFAVVPFLEGFVKLRMLLDVFLSLMLLSGIQAASRHRHAVLISVLLSLPMFLSIWISHFVFLPQLRLTGYGFGVLFLGYTAVLILRHVFQSREVTRDVIHGALVVYLLLGILGGFVFALLEGLRPGSFDIPGGMIEENRLLFIYYSFITLTTLGYGDITPLTAPACSLSLLEAAFGQIYLAVLLARLVGIHISQTGKK
jgi:voltage-gated potassium channel